jgi:hypothetical protein
MEVRVRVWASLEDGCIYFWQRRGDNQKKCSFQMEESGIENLLNHWEFDIRMHCNCMCS